MPVASLKTLKKLSSFPFSLFIVGGFFISPLAVAREKREKELLGQAAPQSEAAEPQFEIVENEDFEIVENEDKKESSYLQRTVSGKTGFTYAPSFTGPDYRLYSYAGLGWKDQFDWLSLNIEMLFFRRDFQYALQASSEDLGDLEDEIAAIEVELASVTAGSARAMELELELAELERVRESRTAVNEFNFTLLNNELVFREAYATINLSDNSQLLLGVHTIVWGQLDFVSPVDFILPLRIGSTGLGLTKADNRNPQTSAILYLFPISEIELQLYYFPFLDFDEAFRENLLQESGESSEYVQINKVKFPSPSEEGRYAARLLFYLNRLTLGFTYYNGWFQFGLDSNTRLRSDAINPDIYYLEGAPLLERIEFYGIEMATPIGKWILKFEGSYFSLTESFELDIEKFNDQTLGFLPLDDQYQARQRYIDWIISENDGKLDVTQNIFFSALGVDANLDKWLINLGLLFFLFDLSDSAERGSELYEEAEEVDEGGPFGSSNFGLAPTVNVAYYLDKNKESAIGFAGGFLNSGFGAIAYFAQDYQESLRIVLGLEYLFLFSNGLVDVEGYEIKDAGFPAPRIAMEYRF